MSRRRGIHLIFAIAGALGLHALPASAAAELDRLFFTPERREMLDRQRALNTLEAQTTNEDPQVLVNGQVRRSTGKRTTWINGQPQNEIDATRTGIVAQPDARGSASVRLHSGDETPVSVKVGETLNRGTQETSNPLGDGQIVVHRRGTAQATPARQAPAAR